MIQDQAGMDVENALNLSCKKKCEVTDSVSASAHKKRINILSEQFTATWRLTVMF